MLQEMVYYEQTDLSTLLGRVRLNFYPTFSKFIDFILVLAIVKREEPNLLGNHGQ
jgi:hypothetical protein